MEDKIGLPLEQIHISGDVPFCECTFSTGLNAISSGCEMRSPVLDGDQEGHVGWYRRHHEV